MPLPTTIYNLFHTDSWHSYESMRFLGSFSSKDKLISALEAHIRDSDEPIPPLSDYDKERIMLDGQTHGWEGDGEFYIFPAHLDCTEFDVELHAA